VTRQATAESSPGDEILVDYGINWREKVMYGNHDMPQRSVKDLKTNGICLDNIRPGLSTISGAGRGAFSTRYIPKGNVIAPAPLIPIRSRDSLKTTWFITNATTNEREFIFGHQLLRIYCLGHTNSSLLFFPYAPTVNLINHDPEKPNVKLQWSQSSLHYGKEWLEYPLDEFKEVDHAGLLLEYVATRDIEIGKEIL